MIRRFRWAWDAWRDRCAVMKLERHYRKHPEHREEDAHLFRSGAAGYEL